MDWIVALLVLIVGLLAAIYSEPRPPSWQGRTCDLPGCRAPAVESRWASMGADVERFYCEKHRG